MKHTPHLLRISCLLILCSLCMLACTGVVIQDISQVVYGGNWTLDAATQHLRLQGTSSSVQGGGFGNPGGIISYNCHYLIMAQPDLEGFGKVLEKQYKRVSTDEFFENFHAMN